MATKIVKGQNDANHFYTIFLRDSLQSNLEPTK
jgi:hypothetical protein